MKLANRGLLGPFVLSLLVLCTSVARAIPEMPMDDAAVAQPTAPPTTSKRDARRVGLVLSGGGARGLAHVGVLKVLERERIPVHVISGTSMGAIIGGLYASGISAAQLEAAFLKIQWDSLFSNRVSRQALSQRRKEEDFRLSPLFELGLRDGELRVPLGVLSGRGLENLLRRYTLRVSQVSNFDELPIPYRAVATDMESGAMVVLNQGDLAAAMRSSMSVPGVFAPVEMGGRILGDGGLVNNVPIDVARDMGADVVIAVSIGTPLAPRSTLGSLGGLTTQMLNILTEQNVQRSLSLLRKDDVLIQPSLGELTSADFDKTAEFIALGEQGANQILSQLEHLRLSPQAYAQWRESLPLYGRLEGQLTSITFEGTTATKPQRWLPQLESKVGEAFELAKAERDVQSLAATGDYSRTDFVLRPGAEGSALVFELQDKPWGPNYFNLGLDLSTNFSDDSTFKLKLGHNRRWLDDNATEWRNYLQVGANPNAFTELYRPISGLWVPSRDWFIAGWAGAEQRSFGTYDSDSLRLLGRYDRRIHQIGVDLGQPWGRFGEIRLGVLYGALRDKPKLLSSEASSVRESSGLHEWAGRLRTVVDQLDDANFPRRGYRLTQEVVAGEQSSSWSSAERANFYRLEASVQSVHSWGLHTFSAYGRVQSTDTPLPSGVGRYTLGGLHQLSGYQADQLSGNTVLFGRLTYLRRLSESPVLTRGGFVGATLELGNAWSRRHDIRWNDVRSGTSVFYGLDTGIGPLYLGLTYARRGAPGVYLTLGRP